MDNENRQNYIDRIPENLKEIINVKTETADQNFINTYKDIQKILKQNVDKALESNASLSDVTQMQNKLSNVFLSLRNRIKELKNKIKQFDEKSPEYQVLIKKIKQLHEEAGYSKYLEYTSKLKEHYYKVSGSRSNQQNNDDEPSSEESADTPAQDGSEDIPPEIIEFVNKKTIEQDRQTAKRLKDLIDNPDLSSIEIIESQKQELSSLVDIISNRSNDLIGRSRYFKDNFIKNYLLNYIDELQKAIDYYQKNRRSLNSKQKEKIIELKEKELTNDHDELTVNQGSGLGLTAELDGIRDLLNQTDGSSEDGGSYESLEDLLNPTDEELDSKSKPSLNVFYDKVKGIYAKYFSNVEPSKILEKITNYLSDVRENYRSGTSESQLEDEESSDNESFVDDLLDTSEEKNSKTKEYLSNKYNEVKKVFIRAYKSASERLSSLSEPEMINENDSEEDDENEEGGLQNLLKKLQSSATEKKNAILDNVDQNELLINLTRALRELKQFVKSIDIDNYKVSYNALPSNGAVAEIRNSLGEKKEKLKKSIKDVPWQTMILMPVGKKIAKSAAVASLTGAGMASAPAALLASGLVAGALDTRRVVQGSRKEDTSGRQELYKSAASNLSGGRWLGEKYLSEAEREKNKWVKGKYLGGYSSVPMALLRRIGMGFGASRNMLVQYSLGVTSDRSKISKAIDEIVTSETALTEEVVKNWVKNNDWKKLKKVGLALARLRAFGGDNYGDADVYGPEGSPIIKVGKFEIGNRVNEEHDSKVFKKFNEILNKVISESEDTKINKDRWMQWFDNSSSRGKGNARVAMALIFGSTIGTIVGLGAIQAGKDILSGESTKIEELKAYFAEKAEHAVKVDIDTQAEQVLANLQENDVPPTNEFLSNLPEDRINEISNGNKIIDINGDGIPDLGVDQDGRFFVPNPDNPNQWLLLDENQAVQSNVTPTEVTSEAATATNTSTTEATPAPTETDTTEATTAATTTVEATPAPTETDTTEATTAATTTVEATPAPTETDTTEATTAATTTVEATPAQTPTITPQEVVPDFILPNSDEINQMIADLDQGIIPENWQDFIIERDDYTDPNGVADWYRLDIDGDGTVDYTLYPEGDIYKHVDSGLERFEIENPDDLFPGEVDGDSIETSGTNVEDTNPDTADNDIDTDTDFLETDSTTTDTIETNNIDSDVESGNVELDANPQSTEISSDADSINTSEIGVEDSDVTGVDTEVSTPDLEVLPLDAGEQLVSDAIYNAIRGEGLKNTNGSLNVLTKLFNVVNPDRGVIHPDSGFAIAGNASDIINGSLPSEAVAWFFSDEQMKALAENIDHALEMTPAEFAASLGDNFEGDPAKIQEMFKDLNSGGVIANAAFDNLSTNQDLLKSILTLAQPEG